MLILQIPDIALSAILFIIGGLVVAILKVKSRKRARAKAEPTFDDLNAGFKLPESNLNPPVPISITDIANSTIELEKMKKQHLIDCLNIFANPYDRSELERIVTERGYPTQIITTHEAARKLTLMNLPAYGRSIIGTGRVVFIWDDPTIVPEYENQFKLRTTL